MSMPLSETPPPAWGRLFLLDWHRTLFGNTPTRVGKTQPNSKKAAPNEKHPHPRGEDASEKVNNPRSSETPPPAWGRLKRLWSMREM